MLLNRSEASYFSGLQVGQDFLWDIGGSVFAEGRELTFCISGIKKWVRRGIL